MSVVHLVMGTASGWEEQDHWPVRAFTDARKAEAFAVECQRLGEELLAAKPEPTSRRAEIEHFDGHALDPNFRACDGFAYNVVAVPLETGD